MGRSNLSPAKGDKIEVIPSPSQAVFGTGRSVTAFVVDTGVENGRPVIDYQTLSGDRRWAYLYQVIHVYEAAEHAPA